MGKKVIIFLKCALSKKKKDQLPFFLKKKGTHHARSAQAGHSGCTGDDVISTDMYGCAEVRVEHLKINQTAP